MKYCKKCLQPDTRPGIVFNDEGVCMACVNAEARKKVDWKTREKELASIVDWAKEQNAVYDCAIGVSGGKDSTFQALYCRDKLGMNCLLVNCVPDGISEAGAKNIENLIQKGFDVIQIRPNPVIERELCRRAFYKYGNFVKPVEYTLYASTYQIALDKGIPLVVQGENDADVFGVDKLPAGPDAMNWANVDTVSGGDASEFVSDEITERDLRLYQFPDVDEMRAAGMRAIFLEYYAKEWGHWNNTEFSLRKGLSGRDGHDPAATGKINRFSSLDADLKVVNQMFKYYKFGFGAASDEVNYAIREGMMTREQGVMLLERYDGSVSNKYIFALCEYLSIPLHEFWETLDKYVNKDLFDKVEGRYKPKFVVGQDFM
jgi:N-acetyl sugar amidotransferase